MTTVNTIKPKPQPVICGFSWEKEGGGSAGSTETLTYGAKTMTYQVTYAGIPLHFVSELTLPSGVTASGYLWRFSDGTTLTGANVNHEFKIVDIYAWASLTVFDSRELEWSAHKNMNLVPSSSMSVGIPLL